MTADALSFTAPAQEVRQALTAVLPHAAKPADVAPILAGVQLRSDGTTVTLAATDRYTLGTWALPIQAPEFEVVLPVSEVRRLLKSIDRKSIVPLTFVIGDQAVQVDDGRGSLLTLTVEEGTFPKWPALIPAEHGKTEVEAVAYNPTYIGRYAKAADRNEPMRMAWGPKGANGPCVVTVGEHFVGLIMPVSLAG